MPYELIKPLSKPNKHSFRTRSEKKTVIIDVPKNNLKSNETLRDNNIGPRQKTFHHGRKFRTLTTWEAKSGNVIDLTEDLD